MQEMTGCSRASSASRRPRPLLSTTRCTTGDGLLDHALLAWLSSLCIEEKQSNFLVFFLFCIETQTFFVGLHLFWCRRRCSHGTLAHKEFRFQFGPLSMQLEVMQIPQSNKVRVVCPKGRKRLEKLHHPSLNCTEFENHRKSLIQYCERSELLLHFEWTKVN